MPKKKFVYCPNKEKFFTKSISYKNHEKLLFEYIKIKKIYNVYECPIQWQMPLFLCFQFCQMNQILMKCNKL